MTTETAAATAKAPKRKLIDAYKATLTIHIPIDMANSQSLVDAFDAVEAAKTKFVQAGATVETHAGMAKIPAPEKAA